MARRERGLIAIIWNNFVNSIKPRKFKGTLVGTDHIGNKYFEIPSGATSTMKRHQRWFEPTEKNKFDEEMPAEWEAWLRYRRKTPPTEQEVLQNQSLANMKKENAAALDAVHGISKSEDKQGSFPVYPDYEISAGTNTPTTKKK